ncbi:MAG TPA: hypothetical protein VGC72_13890 [Candidatus Elarobacter sp.]|jgi:hypothetical protein
MHAISFIRGLTPALVALMCAPLAGVAAPPAAAPPAASATTPIAVQDYEVEGVKVELLGVKRTSDGFLTVTWQYRNTTDQPKAIGANTGAMAGAWSAPYSLSWDFRVIAAGKELKVPGQTMAAKHAKKVTMLPGKKVLANWAKVPDPGPDVTKVSISLQGIPMPFDDVPIS